MWWVLIHCEQVVTTHLIALTLGTLVKEEAIPRFVNVLSPMANNWDVFARQIGVPASQISLIRASNPPTSPSDPYACYTCLSQALEWWVNNHDNPTYEAIIAVLHPERGQTTPVMNRALAHQVKEFMAKQQQGEF